MGCIGQELRYGFRVYLVYRGVSNFFFYLYQYCLIYILFGVRFFFNGFCVGFSFYFCYGF